MTRRFLRELWSPLRREMDAMAPGEILTRSRGEWTRGCGAYNTALVSARRLREAYEGKRVWTVRVTPCKTQFTITHHTKP